MPRLTILAVLTATLLFVGTAGAHGVGMSQLTLRLSETRIEGEIDIQLRDARLGLGLDPQETGEAGWRELRLREASLRAALARDLSLRDTTNQRRYAQG